MEMFEADCRESLCAYFLFKEDGCRNGPDCEFCHLCDTSDIKRRKKERAKAVKARHQARARARMSNSQRKLASR